MTYRQSIPKTDCTATGSFVALSADFSRLADTPVTAVTGDGRQAPPRDAAHWGSRSLANGGVCGVSRKPLRSSRFDR